MGPPWSFSDWDSTARGQVHSLIREPKSHSPCSAAKKKKAPAVLVTTASLNLLEQEPECHPSPQVDSNIYELGV